MRGGDVTVTSKPGKGSVFTVHLPDDTINAAMVPSETCDPMSGNGRVRPCSGPASKRSWQGAPKTRSTPCHTSSILQAPWSVSILARTHFTWGGKIEAGEACCGRSGHAGIWREGAP